MLAPGKVAEPLNFLVLFQGTYMSLAENVFLVSV